MRLISCILGGALIALVLGLIYEFAIYPAHGGPSPLLVVPLVAVTGMLGLAALSDRRH